MQNLLSTGSNEELVIDRVVFGEILNRFLASLSKRDRIIFVRRYWYFFSVREIASQLGVSETAVKQRLFRIRNAFGKTLAEGGIFL